MRSPFPMATPTTARIDDNNDKDLNARVVVRPFYDLTSANYSRIAIRNFRQHWRRERHDQQHVVDPSHHHHARYRDLVRLQ